MNKQEKAQEILQVVKTNLPRSVYLELSDRITDGLEEAYRFGIDSKTKETRGTNEFCPF